MTDKVDIIIRPIFLNPKYQNSTTIRFGGKGCQGVRRIHGWQPDYRENMANTNYKEIRSIMKHLNLHDKVYNNACFIYKGIYIDENISSRNKIKRSLFIYCIFKSASEYKVGVDVIALLERNALTIGNYNKALLKIDDDEKLFLNKNMKNKFHLLNKNWKDNTITLMDIIIKYNHLLKSNTSIVNKLNNNSILLGTFYLLINDKTKKFYNVYDITSITIAKFLECYPNEV